MENKTVYLESGGTAVCEYDPRELTLSSLWNTIFVVTALLNLLAIVGNLVVVAACYLTKGKPPMLMYINALAFSDLAYAVVSPFYNYRFILKYWPKLKINFGLTGDLSHRTSMLGSIFATFSSWMVVALTFERLIITKYPFKAAHYSTPKIASFVILCVFFLCVVVNFVGLYDVYEVPVTFDNCTGDWNIPRYIDMGNGTTYIPLRYYLPFRAYAIISAIVFMYALPTLMILCSNITIIRVFKENKKFNEGRARAANIAWEEPAAQKSNNRLTKMIIIVSVIFMICCLPDVIKRILWKFSPTQPVASILQPIANLFLMINVGANVIIYALLNKRLFDTISQPCRSFCGLPEDSESSEGFEMGTSKVVAGRAAGSVRPAPGFTTADLVNCKNPAGRMAAQQKPSIPSMSGLSSGYSSPERSGASSPVSVVRVAAAKVATTERKKRTCNNDDLSIYRDNPGMDRSYGLF